MSEIDWSRLKASEIRALAARNAIVIVPIGATEQHGPHLPSMVDWRCVHEVSHRAARIMEKTTPTVVTPIMLASRFVVATAPTLGGIATRVSWRATIDQALDAKTALSKGVRDLFGIREDAEVSSALRENIAKRLLRCARETASAMHSFADVAAAITARDGETSTNAPLQQRWNTLVQLEAIREKLLLRAAVVDRDEAFRDAVKTGRIAHEAFDRVVVS